MKSKPYFVMKYIVILCLAVFVLSACKQTTNSEKMDVPPKQEVTTVVEKPKTEHHQKAYRHNLSMYNDKYVMEIMPHIDQNELKPTVLLYKIDCCIKDKIDTIFHEQISKNRLLKNTRDIDMFAEGVTIDTLRQKYLLDKIVYHGVRADRLYFEGTYTSNDSLANLKVRFNLQYYRKNTFGNLSINGVNKRGWGRNRGDDEGFNLIETGSPK